MGFSWGVGRNPDRTPTDPLTRPVRATRPRREVWRLLTTRGRLAVRVCGLCAALVVVDGGAQHDATHAATLPGGDR